MPLSLPHLLRASGVKPSLPGESRADDVRKVVMPGPPAQPVLQFRRVGDEHGRIARPSRAFSHRQGPPGDALHLADYLAHAGAAPITAIEAVGIPAGA